MINTIKPNWFNRSEADKVFNEDDLRQLGLDPELPSADWYFHHRSCVWVVQEDKERNYVKDAIRQLESTVKQLRKMSKPVHQVQIKLKRGIGSREERIYTKDYFRGYLLRKIGRRKAIPVRIDGMPVLIKG